jgi:hypothetical protein
MYADRPRLGAFGSIEESQSARREVTVERRPTFLLLLHSGFAGALSFSFLWHGDDRVADV